MSKKINILGQEYTLRFENTRTETVLKGADGECRWYKKEIIIDDELEENEQLLQTLQEVKKYLKGHKIADEVRIKCVLDLINKVGE